MKRKGFLVLVMGSVSGVAALADEVDIPNEFTAGTPAVADEVNENFSAVELAIDDNAQQLTSLSNATDALESEVDALQAENTSLTQLLQSLALETSVNPSIDTTISINDTEPQAGSDALVIGDLGPFVTAGLLRFDLAHIPAGSVIESAELRLWSREWDGGLLPDMDVCVQEVTSDWDETVLWTTAPTQDSTCLATVTLNQEAGVYYWAGLSELAQSWVDSENFGLALVVTGPEVTSFRAFSSSEGVMFKPELKVQYSILQ